MSLPVAGCRVWTEGYYAGLHIRILTRHLYSSQIALMSKSRVVLNQISILQDICYMIEFFFNTLYSHACDSELYKYNLLDLT